MNKGIMWAFLVLALVGFAEAIVNVECGHGIGICDEDEVQTAFNTQDTRDDSQDAQISGKASTSYVNTRVSQEENAREGADEDLQEEIDENNHRDNVQDWRLTRNEWTDRSQWGGIYQVSHESQQGDEEIREYISTNTEAWSTCKGGNGYGIDNLFGDFFGESSLYKAYKFPIDLLKKVFVERGEFEDLENAYMQGGGVVAWRAARLGHAVTQYGVTCYPSYNPREAKCVPA